jgi:hypothetical protein
LNFRRSKTYWDKLTKHPTLHELENAVRFSLYHDESGSYHCDRWVSTGLLWVPEKEKDYIYNILREVRDEYGYYEKIHYYDLQSKFEGKYSAKARVARDWMKRYVSNISYITYFYCIVVDRQHFKYDRSRFAKRFHEYNKFTSQGIKNSLIWNMNMYKDKVIILQIFSDNKVKRPEGLIADGVNTDNFEEYIKDSILLDEVYDSRIPKIILKDEPIICIDKEVANKFPKEYEILQLCDILVSSVSGTIFRRSKVETKSWLSDNIAKLILDTRKKPWQQEYGLHRRFSVSYFPDQRGCFYNNGTICLSSNSEQQILF